MDQQAQIYKQRDTTGFGADTQPPKPSPWAAISIEEKIERLHDALLALRQSLRWQSSHLNDVQGEIEKLADHWHNTQGAVTVPFRQKYGHSGMIEAAQSSFDPLA